MFLREFLVSFMLQFVILWLLVSYGVSLVSFGCHARRMFCYGCRTVAHGCCSVCHRLIWGLVVLANFLLLPHDLFMASVGALRCLMVLYVVCPLGVCEQCCCCCCCCCRRCCCCCYLPSCCKCCSCCCYCCWHLLAVPLTSHPNPLKPLPLTTVP